MTINILSQWLAATVLAWCGTALVWAQAPGEDPVILGKKLVIQMMPTGPAQASGNIDGNTGTRTMNFNDRRECAKHLTKRSRV